MSKFLLISGSPRKGNTDFVLNRIFKALNGEKELILLRDKDIRHCLGCLSCDKSNKCVIRDDMQDIYKKMSEADVLIIGTPNYFDNVPGLLKDFIDRTNPLYETDKLKGKKFFSIIVGGGEIKNSKRVADQALKYFADCHNLDFVDSFIFKALNSSDIENNPSSVKVIDSIIKRLNSEDKIRLI